MLRVDRGIGMVTITKGLSFFLCWVTKTQSKYQTKMMM